MESCGFNPIATASVPISRFADAWSRVGDLADYFGEVSSPRRADPVRHSNIYSTILNELLEISVHLGRPNGRLDLLLCHDGSVDRFTIRVDCDDAARRMVIDAIGSLDRHGAKAAFRNALLTPGQVHPCLGLFELIADYAAQIVTSGDEDTLTLQVDVCLKDDAQ